MEKLELWLKREQILTMPASTELDALIAEKVLEWRWEMVGDSKFWYIPGIGGYILPRFSKDVGDAWSIVDKFGGSIELCGPGTSYWSDQANCEIVHEQWYAHLLNPSCGGHGETAPLAICRAGLTAAMMKKGVWTG